MRIRTTNNNEFIESWTPKVDVYVDFNIYKDLDLKHTIRQKCPIVDLLRICYNLTKVLMTHIEHGHGTCKTRV